MIENAIDFDLLGCKVKASSNVSGVGSHKIISLISDEIEELKKAKPFLDDKELAVLVALKFGKENLELKDKLTTTVKDIENSLELIEELMGESSDCNVVQ
jgi:hypothetical protein